MIKKISLALNLVAFWAFGFLQAQNPSFAFKSTLSPTTQTWHHIELPHTIYQHIKSDFSDIRILGTDKAGKTIEVPYVLASMTDLQQQEAITFDIFNQVKQDSFYYFTLRVKGKPQQLNFIQLDFENQNFDWEVSLEGSEHMKKWFQITEHQRLVSIANQHTNYRFTDLHFPSAEYNFYRLKIKSNEPPILKNALIEAPYAQKPLLRPYPIKNFSVKNDSIPQYSIVTINLPYLLPVSSVELVIADSLDYKRQMSIHAFKVMYRAFEEELFSDFISSDEKAHFDFPNTLTNRLILRIQNGDNSPLNIKNVIVKGNPYQLFARFPQAGNYALYYGNYKLQSPDYDIAYFKEKIPNNIPKLAVLKTESLETSAIRNLATHNKLWLWLILGALIAILGWFSYKMLLHSPQN